MRVGLLSGQVFSPFGEDCLAGSHGGGISLGINISIGSQILHCIRKQRQVQQFAGTCGEARWSVGIGAAHCLRPYGGVCILQACWRTYAWSLSDAELFAKRPSSLCAELFPCQSVPGVVESLKIVTRANSSRVAKFAFDYAVKHGRRKVTAVHKANIMWVTLVPQLAAVCRQRFKPQFKQSWRKSTTDYLCLLSLPTFSSFATVAQ